MWLYSQSTCGTSFLFTVLDDQCVQPEITEQTSQTSHVKAPHPPPPLHFRHVTPWTYTGVNIGFMLATKYRRSASHVTAAVCTFFRLFKGSAAGGKRSETSNKRRPTSRLTSDCPETFLGCCQEKLVCMLVLTTVTSAGIQMLQESRHRASTVARFSPRSSKHWNIFIKSVTVCTSKSASSRRPAYGGTVLTMFGRPTSARERPKKVKVNFKLGMQISKNCLYQLSDVNNQYWVNLYKATQQTAQVFT